MVFSKYLCIKYYRQTRTILKNIISLLTTQRVHVMLYNLHNTSFTTVFFSPFHARIAFDVTAPIERAPALFGPGELVRVVPASATHQVAAVRACGNPDNMIIHTKQTMTIDTSTEGLRAQCGKRIEGSYTNENKGQCRNILIFFKIDG